MSVLADQSRGDAADRPSAVAVPTARWLPLLGILTLAVLLRLLIGTNVDVSWDITLAEKVLAGQRLYVDIIEVNPPATMLLYLPAALIERAFGLRAEIAVDALVLFAACCSIFVAGRILHAAPLLGDLHRWRLAAFTLAVLTLLPTRTFGEREHIAVLTLLPFLALAMVRARGLSISPAFILIASIGAGLTMVIKPHFAIPIGMVILTTALCARSFRPVFAVENWIAGLVAAAYGVFVVITYPEFISDIVPLVQAVYLPMQVPLWRLLASAAVLCWLAAICMLARWNGKRLAAPPHAPLLAASVGFFLVYMMQGKGWPYHAYPMLALMFIAIAFAASEKKSRVWATGTGSAPPTRLQQVVAILPVVAIALTSAVYFNIAENTNVLIEPIRRISQHPKMLIITSDLSVGHPLTRQVGGTWVSRVPSTWITAGVIHRHQHETLAAATKATLNAYAKRDREMLAEEIRQQKPDVIVLEREIFDWDAWARSEPVVAEELKAYRVAATIGYFILLQRVQN